MKILIIGDSNGVGERKWVTHSPDIHNMRLQDTVLLKDLYRGDYVPFGLSARPVCPDELLTVTHPTLNIELEKYGHVVVNCSVAGTSNFDACRQLEHALGLAHPRLYNTGSMFLNPDVIVWVLTDPFRELRNWTEAQDYYHQRYKDLVDRAIKDSEYLVDLHKRLLQYAINTVEGISNYLNIPVILVESLTPTLGIPIKCRHHVIKDWFQRWVDVPLPIGYSLGNDHIREQLQKVIRERGIEYEWGVLDKLLTDVLTWRDALAKRKDIFPDGGHLAREPLAILAREINDIVGTT